MSEGNRRSSQLALADVASGNCLFRLEHPALTPMPEELRPHGKTGQSAPVSLGVVAVRRERSRRGYDTSAPWVTRTKAVGLFADMRTHLEAARELVLAGDDLLTIVADGTLWGWRLRMALSSVVGEALANWDRRPGRTQAERLAVLDRALGEMAEQAPRGGWTVTP